MAERKEYRSAIRSRRMIRQAFLELLREKPYERITVTDIVNRADINRSTFYAHYPDVLGLVEEIMSQAINNSINLISRYNYLDIFSDPIPFLQDLTRIGIENVELYKLLGQSDFALRQVEMIKSVLTEKAVSNVDIPEEIRCSNAFRIHINFFVGGILNTYQQWILGNLDCSTDEIVAQIGHLIQSNAELYRNWSGQ